LVLPSRLPRAVQRCWLRPEAALRGESIRRSRQGAGLLVHADGNNPHGMGRWRRRIRRFVPCPDRQRRTGCSCCLAPSLPWWPAARPSARPRRKTRWLTERGAAPAGSSSALARPRLIGLGAAGLVTGLLAGLLGVGGGFIVVPVLVLFAGFEMHRAIATSLLVIAVVSVPATISHLMAGQVLPLEVAVPFAGGGIAGFVLGSSLAVHLSGPRLQQVFGAVLLLMAAFAIVDNFGSRKATKAAGLPAPHFPSSNEINAAGNSAPLRSIRTCLPSEIAWR